MPEKKASILLVEDEENLQEALKLNLELEGYDVTCLGDGASALKKVKEEYFDLILLDVMLPELDGFDVSENIRLQNIETPILMLSARSGSADRVTGLKKGADDYLTKPFSMEELLARINAIIRRTEDGKGHEHLINKIGDIKYEPSLRLIHLKDGIKKLTTKENQLLELLVKNENEVLDRQATLRAVWGDDNYFNGRSMDVYIAKLRKMLKEDSSIEIMNIHGKGFKLIIKKH